MTYHLGIYHINDILWVWTPLPVTVANESLVRDPLLKMLHVILVVTMASWEEGVVPQDILLYGCLSTLYHRKDVGVSKNMGKPPNHPLKNKVFHYKKPSILVVFPLFLVQHPCIQTPVTNGDKPTPTPTTTLLHFGIHLAPGDGGLR